MRHTGWGFRVQCVGDAQLAAGVLPGFLQAKTARVSTSKAGAKTKKSVDTSAVAAATSASAGDVIADLQRAVACRVRAILRAE